MRFIEAKLLNEVSKELREYRTKYENTYYANILSLNLKSLQNESLALDKDYFDELKFIISVINSIIRHPHIANKEERVIIRAEQASNITSESLILTMQDPSLWKETKNLDMQPEYIHHKQYTDELTIYENLFIGLLINLLNNELILYKKHYLRLITTLDNTNKINNEASIIEGISIIDSLLRKLRYIKNSYFYKEVSKVRFNELAIKPTNILLKDRLYNYCFKFYKKFIVYEDVNLLVRDYNYYVTNLILKALAIDKYEITKKFEFTNKIFTIELNTLNPKYIDISVTNINSNIKYKHRLILNANDDEAYLAREDDIISYNMIDIWNIYDLDNKKYITNKITDEIELIRSYLNKLTLRVKVDSAIYSKYCIKCRSMIEEDKKVYSCSECHAIYTYLSEDEIWLIR